MTCFHPLKGWRSRYVNKSGKRSIVFNQKDGFSDKPMKVPCGQCIGCRLEHSRQWAMRCVHEASLYDQNCFITLTYAPEHLPEDESLNLRHFQLFMKKLRKKYGPKIRFFHAGEYGAKYRRPHYHAILFNHAFTDMKPWKKSPSGAMLYRSAELEKLWPYGYSSVGHVTFESAAYVARYVMKKITGDQAEQHYKTETRFGEIFDLKPEYTTMSRRPGIATDWFKRFKSDVYPLDEVVQRGIKMRPPRYYDKMFELEHPDDYRVIKAKRKSAARKHTDDQTPERLRVRERCTQARAQQLIRGIDNDT